MALNIWTGFHWCSPVNANNNAMAEESLQKVARWGAVILVSSVDTSSNPNAQDESFVDACNQVMNARDAVGGGRSLDQSIARVYFATACSPSLSDVSSVSQADSWLKTNGYYNSLNYFVANGGRSCVIFNELNQGGSGQSCSSPGAEPQYGADPRVIGYLGYALVNAYYNQGNRQLYVLVPGPTGLMPDDGTAWYNGFLNYFAHYDLWTPNNVVQTFGQVYGNQVDPLLQNRTMLHHGGTGVFDRIALHCYAHSPSQDPGGLGNATVSGNPALQYIQWFIQGVDASEWIYLTECGGSVEYDDYSEGVAVAQFQYNVSSLNAQSLSAGGFGGLVQAAYGYILDISNAGASRGGIDRVSCHATDGYNYERGVLDF